MKEIIVTSQKQLDEVPADYNGKVIIEFGTPHSRAVVKRKYVFAVVARGNSSVEAWENSSVEAWENSSVVARGDSSVVAQDNSSVAAWENSSVEALDNSSVVAQESSSVVARGNSSVVAWENSSVVAWENSSVVAQENSSVVARDNSSVRAWRSSSVVAQDNSSVVAQDNSSVAAWENSSVEALDNSSVRAWGSSSVVARGNSSVVAWRSSSVVARESSSVVARDNSSVVAEGNARIVDKSYGHKLKVSGNARIVYNPKTPQEYVDYYGLESDGRTVKLYKSAHKVGDKYVSDNNDEFEYRIGEIAEADSLTQDQNAECGHGIHAAYKEWCVDYGANWPDLAILEVEMDLDGLIVPINGSGKVRAARCKVLREVPLSECGLLGKMIEKARGDNGDGAGETVPYLSGNLERLEERA